MLLQFGLFQYAPAIKNASFQRLYLLLISEITESAHIYMFCAENPGDKNVENFTIKV